MVISGWEMYLITRMDAIIGIMFATLLLGAAAAAVFIALTAVSYQEYSQYIDRGDSYERERNREKRSYDFFKKFLKISVSTTVAAMILLCLTPTTKDLAMIYIVPAITKNEQVQKLPANFVKFLNAKMEKWIVEDAADKKSEEQKK